MVIRKQVFTRVRPAGGRWFGVDLKKHNRYIDMETHAVCVFFVFSRFLQGCLVVIFNMLCIQYIHYTYLFNFQPYMLGKDVPHFGKLCFSPWVAVGQPAPTSIFHFGFHLHSKLDVVFFVTPAMAAILWRRVLLNFRYSGIPLRCPGT